MPRPVGFIAELPIERFGRNVRIESNGCWIWTGSRDRYGYGRFCAEGRIWPAHKWIYERCFGPTPMGLELGHFPLSDGRHDPACVCPVHVRPITHRENLLEAPTGIAAIHASAQRCPYGHPYTPENTYYTRRGDRACRTCRRSWGAEFRTKNRTGNPEYLAKQRNYRQQRSEKYNAARRNKYRAKHPKPDKSKVCHVGHSLEDPRNVYVARGSRNCRMCRRIAQQRYMARQKEKQSYVIADPFELA